MNEEPRGEWSWADLPWRDNNNDTVENLMYTLHQMEIWEKEHDTFAPNWSNPLLGRSVFYDLLKRVVRLEERIGE